MIMVEREQLNNYKVFMPCAGIGSRLGSLVDNINKGLVSVNNRPVISYIVDKFDEDVEIVVALGYKGTYIKQFLEISYPNRKFTFVNIDNYDNMFVSANEHSLHINTAQETERYLAGAPVISEKTLKVIKEVEAIGGISIIKRIVSEEKSPATYLIGINMYCSWCKKTTRLAKRQALYWMLNVGSAYQLKTAINFFIPAKILSNCVENRKELELDWTKVDKKKVRSDNGR